MIVSGDIGLAMVAQLAAIDPDAPVQFSLRAEDAARAVAALHAAPAGGAAPSADDLLDTPAMCSLAGRSASTVRGWLNTAAESGAAPGAFKLSGVDWRCPRGEFMALLRAKSVDKKIPSAQPRVTREPIGAWREQGSGTGCTRSRTAR
jgi:hypothetical protein